MNSILALFFVLFSPITVAITSITSNTPNGLYICDTYCYTYMKEDIWLNDKLVWAICDNNTDSFHTLSSLSCYSLLMDQNDNYIKMPWIEKLCNSKIITCRINCTENNFTCIM